MQTDDFLICVAFKLMSNLLTVVFNLNKRNIVPELMFMLFIWCLWQVIVLLTSNINVKLCIRTFWIFPAHCNKTAIMLITVMNVFTETVTWNFHTVSSVCFSCWFAFLRFDIWLYFIISSRVFSLSHLNRESENPRRCTWQEFILSAFGYGQ